MELVKSHWVADTDRVHLSLPFAKIDKQNRLVSGFATLDNVDTSDDVVTAEASAAAFSRFRGNVREMHQPIAAGHVFNFREDSFYDPKTEQFYRGIFVTTYVSEGAQDTWLKVLDGTLSGFSIGGNIISSESQFVADAGKVVRFITDYDLVELSLVDNPANQLANVFSIVKSAEGGTIMKGMVADTHITNVFWCDADEIAKNSSEDTETCLSCGETMERISWFERGGDEASKVASAVAKFLRQKEDNDAVTKQADTTVNGEGGVDMTDEIKKNADEEVVTSEEVAPEAVVEAPVEEVASEAVSAEVVEEAAVEPDFEKMFDSLKNSVHESLETSRDTVQKAVESVEAHVAEVTAVFNEKASELEKSLGELSEKFESIKNERGDVAKRLDALEKSSAIKKSGEVETQPVKKAQRGLWSGTFLGAE